MAQDRQNGHRLACLPRSSPGLRLLRCCGQRDPTPRPAGGSGHRRLVTVRCPSPRPLSDVLVASGQAPPRFDRNPRVWIHTGSLPFQRAVMRSSFCWEGSTDVEVFLAVRRPIRPTTSPVIDGYVQQASGGRPTGGFGDRPYVAGAGGDGGMHRPSMIRPRRCPIDSCAGLRKGVWTRVLVEVAAADGPPLIVHRIFHASSSYSASSNCMPHDPIENIVTVFFRNVYAPT